LPDGTPACRAHHITGPKSGDACVQ